MVLYPHKGFPGRSTGKESACHAGDPGFEAGAAGQSGHQLLLGQAVAP